MFKRALIAFLPAVALVCGLEILVRATGLAWRCFIPRRDPSFECDPLMGHRMKPGLKSGRRPLVNDQGLRMTAHVGRKPPGFLRIVSLGDSCTFGAIGVRSRTGGSVMFVTPYPQLLQQRLNRALHRVQVVNAGVVGYTTYQGIQFVRHKLASLEPDLVTIRFGWNDHLRVPPERAERLRDPPSRILRQGKMLLEKSGLFLFLRSAGEGLAYRRATRNARPGRSAKVTIAVPLPDYKRNLTAMIQGIRALGAEPWVIVAPDAGDVYDDVDGVGFNRLTLVLNGFESFSEFESVHDQYEDATQEAAAAAGAKVIDMAPVYRQNRSQRPFNTWDYVHPTAAGQELEAQELMKELLNSGFLDREKRRQPHGSAAAVRGRILR